MPSPVTLSPRPPLRIWPRHSLSTVVDILLNAVDWPVIDIAASTISYPFRYSDNEWTLYLQACACGRSRSVAISNAPSPDWGACVPYSSSPERSAAIALGPERFERREPASRRSTLAFCIRRRFSFLSVGRTRRRFKSNEDRPHSTWGR